MKPLIIGNWKMQLTSEESVQLSCDLVSKLSHLEDREIVLAPSFTALAAVNAVLKSGPIRLAAQDLFWESGGAYTGEISATMLQEIGVTFVLIGHSERREHLGETDHMVNRKVQAALRSALRPVVCVGELESARAAGRARTVVRSQILKALDGVAPAGASRLALAYEPVWAIGTGRSSSPSDAAEMHAHIRASLGEVLGEAAGEVRILYGGSVSPANIEALMATPGVDGVLVGGASLKEADFTRIAAYGRAS
jgi:triosephosphate isomerase